jgi:hypothetical protein
MVVFTVLLNKVSLFQIQTDKAHMGQIDIALNYLNQAFARIRIG